ncbi:DUF3526 domain-containing protein [Thermodesulfobacteriota bacterium]
MSSLTKQSSGSFLYLLVIWVSIVLIIPRAGVMVAGQFIPVPTAAEISSKLSQKSRELSDQFMTKLKVLSKDSDAAYEAMRNEDLTPEERESRSRELSNGYIKKMREESDKRSQDLAKYDAFLNEDWRNRKAEREKLGFSLSRFSPASAYQLATMNLAGTGMNLKTDYEDQLRIYRDIFNKFRSKKEAEGGSSSYISMMEDNKPQPLDLSEMPKFQFINHELDKIFESTVIDIGIISLYILLIIAGAFIAFIRYDVR